MFTRKLGRSGIEVSALGMGCWAIGGPWWYVGEGEPSPSGWGNTNDQESIRAIHAALDMGVNFFDTADVYGCGHSERILGQALCGRRDKVFIATKFGKQFDEEKKHFYGHETSPELIRSACEASLRRLNMETIDLYQFHWGDYPAEKAFEVREVLEDLVSEGKIRFYEWSTDEAENARVFAQGEHCTAIQQAMNWATKFDYRPTLSVCEEFGLASINRGPLAMGLLTGKFKHAGSKIPGNDIRRDWNLDEGRVTEIIQDMEDVGDVLTSGGRTPAQGALAWLWARSQRTIPIPGFKTVAQAKENAGAMAFGPLSDEQMGEIDSILKR